MFFSVIVPIYKVEKYLKRCVDGVINQTFTDFELILVDDGSPDGCPEICDAYSKKDSRVRVIHKENGGLVSARQAGIKVAQGEYIFNLDGDDAVTHDALQKAYDIIVKTGADIVSFSYNEYKNGVVGEKKDDLAEEGLYERRDMEERIFPKLLSDKSMQHMFYFVWGKAIKRSLILEPQLNVSRKISLGEDLSCAVPCYLNAERVYMSRESVYLYTVRDDSISTSFNTKQIIEIEEVLKLLHGLKVPEGVDFKAQISRYSCFMCFAILAAAAEGGFFSDLKEIKGLILNSMHKAEISKAEFFGITKKSRIAVALMKKNCIGLAFYFLYICKVIKKFKNK